MANNNHSQPAPPTDDSSASLISRLFAARHNDQIVAIRRNQDFAATIASIRRVFPALHSLHPSCIRISSKLPGFGHTLLQLHAEIWDEVLPFVTWIEVSTGDSILQEVVEPIEILGQVSVLEAIPRNTDVKPDPLIVRVQDTHGNIEDLSLPLLSTSTVRELKDSIMRHNNRLPYNLLLSYGECPTLEDQKQLHEYGIQNESTLLLTTEFKIYLVGPNLPSRSVNIVTFARISALKILYLNLVEDCSSSSACYVRGKSSIGHVISCGGESLDETQSLGSFKHLAPDCEILVNKVLDTTSSHADYRGTTTVSVYEPSDTCPLLLKFRVFPESTILDLKVLISNKAQALSSQQIRKFELSISRDTPFEYFTAWQTVQSCGLGGNGVYLRDHSD